MKSRSILSGVNVPIEPASNVDSRVNNNIIIRNLAPPSSSAMARDVSSPNLTKSKDNLISDASNITDDIDEVESKDIKALYSTSNPYANINTDDIYTETNEYSQDVNEYLVNIYQSILLNNNKKLLANLISKNKIVLTKEDLEGLICRKLGKKCIIDYIDPDTTCCGGKPVFLRIGSIRIQESETRYVDFKINYNMHYIELTEKYKISLKLVLIN